MPGSALPRDLEASASPCLPTPSTTTKRSSLFPSQVSALPHGPCQDTAGISGGAALPKHSSQVLIYVPRGLWTKLTRGEQALRWEVTPRKENCSCFILGLPRLLAQTRLAPQHLLPSGLRALS